MPLKRSYSKKKTYGRKRTYRRKATGMRKLSKKVSYLLKNSVEKRIKDFAIATNVTNNWQWSSFTTMALEGASPDQGDGFRTDSTIRASYITIMGNISFLLDADNLGEGMRMVVIQDTQFTPAGGATADDPWQDNRWDSLLKASSRGRYSILMDKVIIQKNAQVTFPIKYVVKLDKLIRYQGANQFRGTMYLGFCGIQSGVGGSQALDVKVRLHYTC